MRLHHLSSVAGILLLASPALAQGPVTIERKLAIGDRVKVQETRNTTYEFIYKERGAKVGSAETTQVVQRYTEEVKSDQPEILYRDYQLSTRSKHKPKAKPEPMKTSLHGLKVHVAGLEVKPDGPYEISKDDREMMRLDRLPAALLPPKKVVKAKESWVVPSKPIGDAIFGKWVPASNQSCEAKVTLRSVKKLKGLEVATFKLKVKIHTERTDSRPAIDMALKGEMKWAVGSGKLLEAKLEGPVTFNLPLGENKKELQAEGNTRWTYRAEVLEVREPRDKSKRDALEPPPPGSRVMVCGLDASHQYKLEPFKRCILCGKELDKKFTCPEECPWAFQYCPQDGAPLTPE